MEIVSSVFHREQTSKLNSGCVFFFCDAWNRYQHIPHMPCFFQTPGSFQHIQPKSLRRAPDSKIAQQSLRKFKALFELEAKAPQRCSVGSAASIHSNPPSLSLSLLGNLKSFRPHSSPSPGRSVRFTPVLITRPSLIALTLIPLDLSVAALNLLSTLLPFFGSCWADSSSLHLSDDSHGDDN